jgi:Cytosolic carboxypeptidase N-terminal domain
VIPSAGGSGASAVGSLSVNSETVKKSPFCMMRLQTYDLYMHNDCFTHGHTQWFYFSVKNVVVGQSINFNIKNFTKSDSLFTEGKYVLSYFLLFFFFFVVCLCQVFFVVSTVLFYLVFFLLSIRFRFCFISLTFLHRVYFDAKYICWQ